MKRNVLKSLAVWCVAASVVHGATPAAGAPKRAAAERHRDPVESMAEAVRDKQPTKAQLGKIHSIWKALPEPHRGNLKNDIVSMTCIGFLVTGDMEAFGKARSAISDMAAFKAETTERCAECGGTGRFRSRCSACGGSGVCPRCQGRGGLSAPRLQGMGSAASMSCPSCRGSGRCVTCRNGTVEAKHPPCNGSGSRMSKEKCKAAFELHRSRVEACLTAELKSRGEKRLAEENRRREEEKRRKEEEFAASQRAKGLVLRDGTWMTPEEKAALDRKDKEEKKFAAEQKAKGLGLFEGKWLTAEELLALGLKHYAGDKIEKDSKLAVRLFTEASELGCRRADAKLALLYHIGDGCEKNDCLSFRYANQAGANSPLANMVLGQLYFLGFKDNEGKEVQDFQKAYSHFRDSWEFSHSVFMTGLMEYHGVGTTKDEKSAVDSFRAAVAFWRDDKWCGYSAMCLGAMCLLGKGIEKDEKQAWMLLCRGARAAFPELVAEAKKGITREDIIKFKKSPFGEGLTTYTPYSYKMMTLFHGKGEFSCHGAKLDLLEQALDFLFNPDVWFKVNYNTDDM